MAITITITDPQDHAPYELRVLAEYFQALANDKVRANTPLQQASNQLLEATDALRQWAVDAIRTTHDEELLSDEERAALRDTIAEAGLEESANAAIAGTSAAIRASAGGDQGPYAVNAGGSDDFAELRQWDASEVSLSQAHAMGVKDRAGRGLDANPFEPDQESALWQAYEDGFEGKPDASTDAAASDGKIVQAASTPSLDSAGMPWDERIHSGSKSVNADGTWRYKRGGDLAERERVEKELKGLLEEGSFNYDREIPGADDDIPPPPVEEDDVPPPPAEEEAPQVDSGAVFRAITAGQKANLSQEDIARCLKDVGLATTVDILTAKPEVLAPLKALIEQASK